MEETIFTKIINGDIPSHKIYEDDMTYAFLDIHPVSEGHVLVIPKTPVEFIWDLDATTYQALMESVHKVGNRVREVLNPPYVGIQVVGEGVPHTHVHIVPFTTTSDFHRTVDMSAEPDHTALAAVAERLKF